jgi:D-alanyl-D-alanine carboxypeptidase/D-alanyl-D-alanine-endopeptidase (penicillin-binding protein 4)
MIGRACAAFVCAVGLAGALAARPQVAAPSAPAEAAEAAALRSALEAVIAPLAAERDVIPAVRIETLDGARVFDRRGDEAFVIASNMKVFTTAAALLALGPQHRWATRALLAGDALWIVAEGDPSLRTLGARAVHEEFLDGLAASLRAAGSAGFREVVLDARCFAGPAVHPLWPADQWQQEYCAPVWGFALEGGCLELRLEDGALRVSPNVRGAFRFDRREPERRDAWSAYWTSDRERVVVSGSGAGKAPLRLADADPQRLALTWLREGLERRGHAVGSVRTPRADEPAPDVPPAYVHRSAWTLGEAVTACNKESDNFLAETLLKTLGRARGGDGSTEAGVAAVRAVLEQSGLALTTLEQADGSGLARAADRAVNRASPAAICAVLRLMGSARAAAAGPVFFDSLVVGGVEGRNRSLFADAAFQPHRVRYKTGWIAGASTLCGYLHAPDGQVLTFAIVVNYERDGTARTNNARFRDFQEQLLHEVLRGWPRAG